MRDVMGDVMGRNDLMGDVMGDFMGSGDLIE